MSTNTQAHPQLEGMPDAITAGRQALPPNRANYLPVRPLRRWLRDYVLRVGDVRTAARQLHQHERQLWRILREQSWVTVKVADSILVAAGEPESFYLLYPLDETAVAEAEPQPQLKIGPRWCRKCQEATTRTRCAQCLRPTRPRRDDEGVL